jgi:hypothetical protein
MERDIDKGFLLCIRFFFITWRKSFLAATEKKTAEDIRTYFLTSAARDTSFVSRHFFREKNNKSFSPSRLKVYCDRKPPEKYRWKFTGSMLRLKNTLAKKRRRSPKTLQFCARN